MKKREKIAPRKTRFLLIGKDHTGPLPPVPDGHFIIRESYNSTAPTLVNPNDFSLDVGGFKHTDSHIVWELVQNYEFTNPHQLLKEFRKHWPWYAKKPCAWVRNPEKDGVPFFGNKDVIIVVYPRNFYIEITRDDMFGPHPARLYYRAYQNKAEVAWIAICQLEAMWHSDERILAALNAEIRNKKLWHSPRTAQIPVIE